MLHTAYGKCGVIKIPYSPLLMSSPRIHPATHMVCREEQDDTMKTLKLIPVNEVKLTIVKLMITLAFSIFVYVLLFIITFLKEAYLHFSELSAGMVFDFLKTYFLEYETTTEKLIASIIILLLCGCLSILLLAGLNHKEREKI